MSNYTAFGKVIGTCDNCRRLIFENTIRYYVKFQHDGYCFCEHCVTVVDPQKEENE